MFNVSKIAEYIFPSNNYDLFSVCLLLTNHKTLYNLNKVLSFEPIPVLSIFTSL